MNTQPSKSLWIRGLRLLWSLFTLILAITALGLFLAWMGGAFHEKVQPGIVPVERTPLGDRAIFTVEKFKTEDSVSAVGSVQPRRKTEIASQILATIREIRVRPGESVLENQLVIVLDDRELLAQQREATAALATAEADVVTRKDDYERVKKLRMNNAVSAEEMNRVEGAFRIAETQVVRAKETIHRIEVLLTYTRIHTSTGGVVAERYADPGDLASPGKPILTIYDPSNLELHASVPESIAAGLMLGQKLKLRVDASNLELQAEVREIVPQAQQATRSVLVKLGLPVQSTKPVLPGMFGRVRIPVGQTEQILIPANAIQRIGQLDLVEVVDPENKLNRRFVRVGREIDGQVEILSGLNAGERIALPPR